MVTHPIPTPAKVASGGGDHHHGRSYLLAILAAVANRIPQSGVGPTRAMLMGRGWNADVWDIGNNQGFLLQSDRAVVVVFAGSNEVGDWWKNAQALAPDEHSLGGRVHAGFLKVLDQGLARALGLPEDPSVPLHVAGHSLGGAVATAFCAHLHAVGNPWAPRCRTVTYGAPRFGNGKFESAYEGLTGGRHWFYANSRDPVPKLPTTFMGYRHVGELFYFTDENELTQPPPDSVGLQNMNPADRTPDQAARMAWMEEEQAMQIRSEEEYAAAKAEIAAELENLPDRISLNEAGELVIAPGPAELQGAVGRWIAGRHPIARYIENLQKP